MTLPSAAVACTHPQPPLVVLAADQGAWTAVCKNCGYRWMRDSAGVPPRVRRTVRASAQQVGVTPDQARALGLRLISVGDHHSPKPATTEQWLTDPRWVTGSTWITAAEWVFTVDNGPDCVVVAHGLTSGMVEAFNHPLLDFAVTIGEHAMMLYVLFGDGADWVASPWEATVHKDGGGRVGMDQPSDGGEGPIVRLILVDSDTSSVAAIREVNWPPRFAHGVHAAVYAQLGQEPTRTHGELREWVAHHRTAQDLAASESHDTLRCETGRF